MLRSWWRWRELLLALGTDQAACLAAVDRLDGCLVHLVLVWLSEHAHDHSAGAMGALMLAEVVGARELLTAVGALEWLVVGVERPVVALEMFFTSETAAAERADERL